MPASENKNSRWNRSTRVIIWIILGLLVAFFMLYFLFKEMKVEEDFKKHKDVEHNHPV